MSRALGHVLSLLLLIAAILFPLDHKVVQFFTASRKFNILLSMQLLTGLQSPLLWTGLCRLHWTRPSMSHTHIGVMVIFRDRIVGNNHVAILYWAISRYRTLPAQH